MDIKKIVTDNLPAIKKLLKFEDEQTEVKAEDVKAVDGTLLRIEPGVEVGASVEVIGEDGQLVAVADGQVELEDGTLLSVEGGIIVEVQAVEGDEQEEEMSEVVEEVAEAPAFDIEKLQEQLINKLNVAITEKIDRLKFAKVEEIETLKAENTQLKEAFELTVKMLEKFEATPVEQPKKTHRNPFKQEASKVDFSKLLKKK